MRQWTFILAVAAAVAGGATSASADSFDFTSCHITAGCGTAPFGTVVLTQEVGNVHVVVDLGSSGNRFAVTGALDQVLFAFNATGIDAGDIVLETSVPPGTSLEGVSGTFTPPSGVPNFGSFGFAIQCTLTCNGGSVNITALSFTVNDATIAELTAPNATGTIFVADAFIGSNSATGVIDVSAVPGPIVGAGLPGLVMALGGILAWRQRRRLAA